MNPIEYGQVLRLSDWFHGWRDGLARIPDRPPHRSTGPVTTPHREALIRKAQDAFHYEHLAYRTAVADAHRRVVAGRERAEQLRRSHDWASAAFAAEARPLTGEDRRRRRLGEDDHPERVIVERRLKEHARKAAAARAAVDRINADIEQNAAEIADALSEARQAHEAAVVRVRRIHEHIHRRLAVYRTSLVRAHPEGAWVNSVLSVRAPEIPGWALPDAYGPDGAAERPVETDDLDLDEPPEEPPAPTSRTIVLTNATTVFGSDPGLDAAGHVTLTAPVAAKRHFTVTKVPGGLELRTRGYGHGPYVAGETLTSVFLEPGDHFDFADRRYTVASADRLEDGLLADCDLVVANAYATTGSQPRLTNMSLVQRKDTVLAIVGPSGAGKSSLCEALLGELSLDSGRIFFSRMRISTHSEQIRAQLGFVPQENKTQLHETLTVGRLLGYAFRLRSPSPRNVREARIESVCDQLKLGGKIDRVVSTLSGGEKRRVSIAMELLTKPRLLMLDEPTSGLDPGMDREVMTMLREYAANGNTVIVVTHSTEHLPLAHQMLVVVRGGAPVYSGPPRHARRKLSSFKTYADLMQTLTDEPAAPAAAFARGRAAKEARHEADKLESGAGAAAKEGTGRGAGGHPIEHPVPAFFRRLGTMISRQWALVLTRGVTGNLDAEGGVAGKTAIRARRAFGAATPLLIAAGAAIVADVVAKKHAFQPVDHPSSSGLTALNLLTTLCMLSGQALSYSDIVTEQRIIERENRSGVGALLVVLSKWLVYAVIAITEGVLITSVFCAAAADRGPGRGLLFGPEIDLMISLSALTVAAMTLGLLVSVLARGLPQAVAVITGVSIAQIAFNGATSDLSNNHLTNALAAIMPDRWGMAAAASSTDLRGISPGTANDALWTHGLARWATDLGVLGALTLVLFTLATLRLRRRLKQPGRRPRGSTRAVTSGRRR